jgi:predicted amidohydrolase
MAFRVALVQFNPVHKSVDRNIQMLGNLISGIKADLLVLPELSNTGYLYKSSNDLKPFSEPCDGSGPFLSAIRGFAESTGGGIVVGYAERGMEYLYNSSAAISCDGVLQNYRKTHLFDSEKALFQPGDTGFSVFSIDEVKIGMMICFDWIFPESARSLALLGAQIIAHPANLVLPYCQNAMITRSIENHIFTITANRIGEEKLEDKTLKFTGRSQITAPDGKVLYQGPQNKPACHIMTIQTEVASNKMINTENDLFQDRRPDQYHL